MVSFVGTKFQNYNCYCPSAIVALVIYEVGYLTVGGATHDLPSGWLKQCEKFLDEFVPIIAEYHALLTTNAIFVRRAAGIGVISAEQAIDYGCTGPVLRGSGVDQDLRRDGEVFAVI